MSLSFVVSQPSFCRYPGSKDSITMSAFFTSFLKDFRVNLFDVQVIPLIDIECPPVKALLRVRLIMIERTHCSAGSPPGLSTFMTSAPKSP
jgi:hypothetical protein